MTTVWSPARFESNRDVAIDQLPLIEDADVVPVADGIDIWDSWPIRTPDGSIADVCGHVTWVALAAPAVGDPGVRHNIAEHRVLLAADDGTFVDLGPLFDDGDALGSRQWAGSTVLDGDRLHAYYTAAGVVGADPPGFRQRLAAATATVVCVNGSPRFVDWSAHLEILKPDPERYDTADETSGEPGFIKAFRDPFPFIHPPRASNICSSRDRWRPQHRRRSSTEQSASLAATARRSTIGSCSIRWSPPTG